MGLVQNKNLYARFNYKRYEVTHMALISLIYIRCVDRLGNAALAQQRALSEFNLDKQVYHTRNDYRCH